MWLLDDHIASFSMSGLHGRLDLTAIVQGIAVACETSAEVEASVPLRIFGLSLDQVEIDDSVRRGSDLIVGWHRQSRPACTYESYFRLHGEDLERGIPFWIEWIISTQTDTLDAAPLLRVWSEGTHGVAIADGMLVRFGNAGKHLAVQMADVSNVGRTWLDDTGGHTRIHHEVFPGRLEKGVIRRARLACYFPDSPVSERRLADLRAHFLSMPPPLTT